MSALKKLEIELWNESIDVEKCRIHGDIDIGCVRCLAHVKWVSPVVSHVRENRRNKSRFHVPCVKHINTDTSCDECKNWQTFFANCSIYHDNYLAKRRKIKDFRTTNKRISKHKRAILHTRHEMFESSVKEEMEQVKIQKAKIIKPKNILSSGGYIYLVTNPTYVGWVKAGCTRSPVKRLNQYQTADPTRSYKMLGYELVNDCRTAEKQLLALLRKNADETAGEWIKIDEHNAREILHHIRKRATNLNHEKRDTDQIG